MMLYDVSVRVMAAATSQDQRSYIKIECQRNKTAKEIFSVLQEACGIYALSYSQVTRWVNDFKNGRECIQDAHQAGRTVTATDSYNTGQLKKLLKSDRRIAKKWFRSWKQVSGQFILFCVTIWRWERFRLGGCHIAWLLISVVWKWPLISFHSLIQKDKTFYQELLQLTKRGWGRMNWNWRDNEPNGTHQAPRGRQSTQSKFKMSMIFAYDRHGILTSHKVESGKTINGKYCEEYIKKTLKPGDP